MITLIDVASKILDRVIPDEGERDKAKLALLKQGQEGAFRELEAQTAMITAEANSFDPWTSRARPTFLYVIYLLLLASIPMGVISAFDAGLAERIATGFQSWLNAIPESLYALFGAGYLGYAASRTVEKAKRK